MASLFPLLRITTVVLMTGLVASQTTPACSLNECDKPNAQAGLSIVNDKPCYTDGDTITYACTGTFFGPKENFCDGSSGWRYDQPLCIELVIVCPSVTKPLNGTIQNTRENYSIYETVDIACNAGYTLVGANRKVCDIDGNFKPAYDPICTVSLSVPQPTTTLSTNPDITTASSLSTLSVEPSSIPPTGTVTERRTTEPPASSADPTEKKTEPPASSVNPIEDNWNGLIIGLTVGLGGGILIIIMTLTISKWYLKHTKKVTVEPGYEMDTNGYPATTNKSFSESWS